MKIKPAHLLICSILLLYPVWISFLIPCALAQDTIGAIADGDQAFVPPYLNNRHLFIRNYDPVVYQGQNQIYDIAQDGRGLMYFGNNVYGVIEYDGIRWRTIPLANNNTAYSLTIASDGRIYVGGFNELGYIHTVNGVSVYRSLVHALPNDIKQFGIVSSVKGTEDGVYFRVGEHILRWHHRQFSILENRFSAQIGDLYLVRGKVHTIDSEGTIYRLDGDILTPIFNEDPQRYGDYIFRTDHLEDDSTYGIPPTHFIFPYGDSGLLLSSWNYGLAIIDQDGYRPFDNEAESAGLINQNYAYGSTVLPNGEYAISTYHGLVIIDQNGKLKAWINLDNGLINSNIRSIYADNQHSLWVGTDYGISQILYPSPFSIYDKSSGLQGQIRMSTSQGDSLYVVTSEGAFRSEPSVFDTIGMTFQKIPGVLSETGYISQYGDSVLIANKSGLYQIMTGDSSGESAPENQMETYFTADGLSGRRFLPLSGKDCRFIEVSQKYPGMVYIGTISDGLYILQEKDDLWSMVKNIEIDDQIFFGAEDAAGLLWVSGVATGGYRFNFPDGNFLEPEVDNYYTDAGLPEGWYVPSAVGDALYLYSDEAFFRYDREAEVFLSDKSFFNDTANIGFIREAPDGNVWVTKGRPRRLMRAVPDREGVFDLATTPFQRFNKYQVRNFGFDRGGVTWFGVGETLLSYDPAVSFDVVKPFRTIIRSIIVNDIPIWGQGSLAKDPENNPPLGNIQPDGDISLPYSHNNLRFDFAGLYLDLEYGNQYRVLMEGLNKDWSKWSENSYKEYNSLPPGDYAFHVMSKNLYGKIGKGATSIFKINPPWWETMWFYGAEVSLFLILLLVSLVMNRTGEQTIFSKTVTLVTIVVFFESIMMEVENIGQSFGGGIPLIQLLLNISMAMVFEPAQKLVGSFLLGRRMRRRLRVTFDPFGHWTGGAQIPKSLFNMDNVDRWFESFRNEFQDIGRKYSQYISDDMILDSNEKADLAAELEDFLGGVFLLQRFATKQQPSELTTRNDETNISYHVSIFPKYWEGSGLVLDKYDFGVSTFIEWFGPMFEQIEMELSAYRSAMERDTPSDKDREQVIAVTEQVASRILLVIKTLVLTDDRQYSDEELDLEQLR